MRGRDEPGSWMGVMGGGERGGVPRDPAANLAWRYGWRREALTNGRVRSAFRQAAFEDVLFWFNAFCWTFEPRSVLKIRPFATWRHQDPVIVAMDEALTESERRESPLDLLLDKSRAQGATWIALMVVLRRWLRDPMFSAGLVTRTEDLVDSAVDPDTLLWKVAWMLKRLPRWMLPRGFDFRQHRSLTEHSIFNPVTGGSLVGYSATGDVARGGRKAVFVMDEFASFRPGEDEKALDSTFQVSNCRFLISTFSGTSGAFYEASLLEESEQFRKVVLDWKDNPTQNRLLYRGSAGGRLVAVHPHEQGWVDRYARRRRKTLDQLARRGHKVEGKERSPWYDAHCMRPGSTPRSIAKELDRNPLGVMGKVFDTAVLERMRVQNVTPPLWRGRLLYDYESLETRGFVAQEGGPLKLWFRPGASYLPPHTSFVLGCDIAAGTGGEWSSNSAIVGIDRQTGEQMLEFAASDISAIRFGRLAVALCRWLRGAYLVWESTGPTGSLFGKEVMETLRYFNVYYRNTEIVGKRRRTAKPGWHNAGDESKGELFESLSVAMDDGKFIPRSEDLIRECGEYDWERGKIVHRPTKSHRMDGRAHGDRCVAGGVAWLGICDRPLSRLDAEDEVEDNPPYGTWAWRERREMEERVRWSDNDPQFCLRDLLGTGSPGG